VGTATLRSSVTVPNQRRRDSGWLLYQGIWNLLRCDEAQVVSGIAHYVISQYGSVRVGARLMERTKTTWVPGLFALLGWVRTFLTVRRAQTKGGVVWIARLSNERRAIEPFVKRASEPHWTQIQYNHWPDKHGLLELLKAPKKRITMRRVFRIARTLHRRHEFFKVLRVVELIAYYARYQRIFREGNFKLAVTSSHSNPHAIAFNLAARNFDVPVVLITHGMPVRPVARLSYDLALVHCEAARETYRAEGCTFRQSFVHGRAGDYVTMPVALPTQVSVGVFLCKDVNEQRFCELLTSLLENTNVAQILVRPHPKNLWRQLRSWSDLIGDLRIRVSPNQSVCDDLKSVDVVLGGNSSVLIDAVVGGRPAAYVADLDYGEPDLHRLVARGLVYELVDTRCDFTDLLAFYQRPEWLRTLSLFANVAESKDEVDNQMIAIMRMLAS
jgi:hypothetical protein